MGRNVVLQCPQCRRTFIKELDRERHWTDVHGPKEQCTRCPYQSPAGRPYRMARHVQERHPAVKRKANPSRPTPLMALKVSQPTKRARHTVWSSSEDEAEALQQPHTSTSTDTDVPGLASNAMVDHSAYTTCGSPVDHSPLIRASETDTSSEVSDDYSFGRPSPYPELVLNEDFIDMEPPNHDPAPVSDSAEYLEPTHNLLPLVHTPATQEVATNITDSTHQELPPRQPEEQLATTPQTPDNNTVTAKPLLVDLQSVPSYPVDLALHTPGTREAEPPREEHTPGAPTPHNQENSRHQPPTAPLNLKIGNWWRKPSHQLYDPRLRFAGILSWQLDSPAAQQLQRVYNPEAIPRVTFNDATMAVIRQEETITPDGTRHIITDTWVPRRAQSRRDSATQWEEEHDLLTPN